ncbi:MAG TPA: response regulator transcription factor [Acidimicrobiales bacterium]|nr:response regulator transcription factor [Acidimicrobiales bacterium]
MATRVLVVDDHEMVAQSVVRILSDEPDLEVVGTAGDVETAVARAREERPDVVVMDYQLPDGDGVAATVRIREDRPDAVVLLLTGTGNEALLVRAIEAGCAGFLTKQKAVTELVAAIRVVASGDAWIPPELVTSLLPKLQRTEKGLGHDLTPRELDVLRLAAEGLPNAAIGERLGLSVNTVRNHMQSAIGKLGAHSKLEAVSVAVREGIISYPG